MLRTTVALLALLLTAPASAAPSPKPRKAPSSRVGRSKRTVPSNFVRAKSTKAVKSGKGSRSRPSSALRVRRSKTVKPSKALVASKQGRRPLRLRALKSPAKVAFHPCASSLPDQAPQAGSSGKKGMEGAVFHRGYDWPVGATLKVGFMDGSSEARKAVAQMAEVWTEHANLKWDFHFGTAPANADILIRFDAPGCTSALGTSSRMRAERGEPSMNLCHMDGKLASPDFARVVLHEFGHALGLYHEHQSPKASYSWNKDAVYQYYAAYGWSRPYVDKWVFERISPNVVDASDYDPNSIMHYAFPPEFTTDGVGFGGKRELSALDKSFIAKMYPGKKVAKPKRRYERRLTVRNSTGRSLRVQAIVRKKKGKGYRWTPSRDLSAAPEVVVPAGAELTLGRQGREAKLIGRAKDGTIWSGSAIGVRIAPAGGYLDREMQTYVVTLDGPPDAPKGQTKTELYDAAVKAMAAGKHEDARAMFQSFVERFGKDDRAPWARFNIVVSLHQQKRPGQALDASYDMIIDNPGADATPFAWYYGGVSAMNVGWCDGAKYYFDYAIDKASGLPADWRSAASEYLKAVKTDPDRWCWSKTR
ncbi:MAG: outer membrane protein assembly factor BamD [Nannocystaceae bacterium]|nr:outer membrane protein assembly factor BamD [Nannocystaceae bacterium]